MRGERWEVGDLLGTLVWYVMNGHEVESSDGRRFGWRRHQKCLSSIVHTLLLTTPGLLVWCNLIVFRAAAGNAKRFKLIAITQVGKTDDKINGFAGIGNHFHLLYIQVQ